VRRIALACLRLADLLKPVQLEKLRPQVALKNMAEMLSATAARLAKRTGSRARSARLIYS